jgi:hypothetical protein
MNNRKQNIKQALHAAANLKNMDQLLKEGYDELFQEREKNLFKLHKVPKLKIHQSSNRHEIV